MIRPSGNAEPEEEVDETADVTAETTETPTPSSVLHRVITQGAARRLTRDELVAEEAIAPVSG